MAFLLHGGRAGVELDPELGSRRRRRRRHPPDAPDLVLKDKDNLALGFKH